MTARRHGRLVAGVAGIVGLWTMGVGCQSTSLPFHAQGGPVLQAASHQAPAPSDAKGPATPAPAPVARRAAATLPEIAPRARIGWEIEARALKPAGMMTGASIVGPDGTMQIGPYGALPVAGLSSEEARVLMEKHLAQYLTDPKVALTVAQAAPVEDAVWRPARQVLQVPSPESSKGVAVAASSMWRPTRRVAAQKPDDAIVAVSMQTPSAATELRLPTGAADLHPTAAPRDNAPTEAIPSAPAPIEVPDPLVHPLPVMVGHHQGHMPPIAAGLDVPREMNKQPLPRYVIEPPDILLVESTVFLKADQPIRGQHLVRPDGTIGLGIYGDVFVAGMTLERAREAVFQYLKADRLPGLKSVNQISVDVLAYNSKWYYVITDGGGYGEQVVRLPITGNETVLDAISQINGLAPVSDKKRIWVARRNPGHGAEQVMPVDWIGISQHGTTSTNYQLLPGDRLYVKADKWRTFDSRLQKVLAPIERVLGVTLLGSETVSSVRGRGVGATR